MTDDVYADNFEEIATILTFQKLLHTKKHPEDNTQPVHINHAGTSLAQLEDAVYDMQDTNGLLQVRLP